MSFSKPFFNSAPSGRRKPTRRELDIKSMHWTEYLEKYPLANGNKYEPFDIDSRQNKWDMDLDPNISNEQEKT